MFTITIKTLALILISTISCVGYQIAVAQNETGSTTNTFNDPKIGITFQYPSDWQIASSEYNEQIFSSDEVGKDVSAVTLIHTSLDGGSFVILPEVLPFPVSLERYFELTKKSIETDPTMQISDTGTPVTVGNLDGIKYNVLINDGEFEFEQTQIVLVKEATGYVIGYTLGTSDPETQLSDINSILDSFKFQ
jgi:hypothetical protein